MFGVFTKPTQTKVSRFLRGFVHRWVEYRDTFIHSRWKIGRGMYQSLILPWSNDAGEAEQNYRSAGFVKTQGTIYLLPPSTELLITKFNAPPRPRSRMSAGAVALCKHFERGGASSEHDRPHPFWPLPEGSNENKTMLAAQILEKMLADARWKNVMMLHRGVAVYEVRNSLGFGMRWTLALEQNANSTERSSEAADVPTGDLQERGYAVDRVEQVEAAPEENDLSWTISEVSFRGFLEPILGLDHELPVVCEEG